MSLRALYFSVVLLVTVTGASAFIHSQVVATLHDGDALATMGSQLSQLDASPFGSWRLISSSSIEGSTAQMLECRGHILREYADDVTGNRVSVFVAVGPQGPMAVHTPDVCFSASEFETVGNQQRLVLETDGREHAFWTMTLRSRGPEQQMIFAMHAWSRGDVWEAPAEQRLAFLGSPYLYRILLVTHQLPTESGNSSCEDFARQFLPILRQVMQSDAT